ncbi:MAG: SAM-dependent chlorinase/fluorinase [Actinomycetota bacterium]
MARTIVFLSDYGLDDEFVGVCHGVIAGIAPEARVVDLTHGVPSQDVLRGAMVLAQNAAFFPEGSVFLSVVDPGVGSARRGVAVETGRGDVLVGPDNGLLSLAWEALGGAKRAVHLTSEKHRLERVSETFHGRDVFAPAAAHLANGTDVTDLGGDFPIGDLVRLDLPAPEVDPGRIRAQVLSVDRYGNIELAAREHELSAAGLEGADQLEGQANETRFMARRVRTFADLRQGELGMLVDSLGWIAVVLNGGSAGEALGVDAGDILEISGE